jgi:endoglucanase
MFETTGDPGALKEAETRILSRNVAPSGRKPKGVVDSEWDWGNPDNIGIYTYLMSSREGRDPALVAQIRAKNQQNADAFVSDAASHAYGRAGIAYFWGANGTVARIAMNLQIAYRYTGNARYLDTAIRQIDYLFGRNYYARSQVTGLGDKPPLYPHHRPSIMMKHAWPGLLVGGGNPGPTSWVDDQDLYEQNEVAINWNAALVYALAGFATGTQEGTGFYAGPILGDAGAPETGAPLTDALAEAYTSDAAPDASLGQSDASTADPDSNTSLSPEASEDVANGD